MSTIRLSGLISGLDTDAIVKGLVDAQKLKNKKTTDKQTLLTWKQERWKDLNTKLLNLYKNELTDLKTQGKYLAKKITSSNEDAVLVSGDVNNLAAEGAHTIEVSQLASSQYVTGGKIQADTVTGKTTLKSLGMQASDENEIVIKIKNGKQEKNLVVTDETTINDFVKACKSIGLNANFDEKQQRIFLSSKASGQDQKFSITTGEIEKRAIDALDNVKSLLNYAGQSSTNAGKIDDAIQKLEEAKKNGVDLDELYQKVLGDLSGEKITEKDPQKQQAIDALVLLRDTAIGQIQAEVRMDATKEVKQSIQNKLLEGYQVTDQDAYEKIKTQLEEEIAEGTTTLPEGMTVEELATYRYKRDAYLLDQEKDSIAKQLEEGTIEIPEDYQGTKEEYIAEKAQEKMDAYTEVDKERQFQRKIEEELYSQDPALDEHGQEIKDPETGETVTKAQQYQKAIDDYYDKNYENEAREKLVGADSLSKSLKTYFDHNQIKESAPGYEDNLQKIGLGEITGEAKESTGANEMTVVAAADAIIKLDGATLYNDSNQLTINGMQITIKGKTTEPVTIGVSKDPQAVYDMVKKFVTSYNTLLKEMNELYYAESSRGYDPLSDDEKQQMTDEQVNKWEKKIKDSILRRDDTLGSLLTSMRSALQGQVEVNGKRYSLANYGIQTSKDYTEKGLLHIYGDKEDPTFAAQEDKLLKAIGEDPDEVMKVMSAIGQNLYDAMSSKCKGIAGVRSSLTFYNDKQMASQQIQYSKKIKEDEKKLIELENKYYKQFAAMETALSKLQSQTNALGSLLGQNS